MQLPPSTPLYKQIEANLKPLFSKRIPKNVFGRSPSSVFIGKYNYPDVFVGPMVGISENVSIADSPAAWYGQAIEKIIEHRLSLARGEKINNVKSTSSRMSLDLRDTALSTKDIDIEVRFEKEPFQKIEFSAFMAPMGASGKMERFSLADNPRIPRKIDNLVEERIKVNEAVKEGYSYGLGNTYYLQRALSVGALGKDKKMVPTRWAITAADSILANHLLKDVKEYRSVDKIQVYSNVWMGNHFEIVVLPGAWEFEQFESGEPGSQLAMKADPLEYEYEPFEGRSDYAEREGGGWYASRLSCVQAMHKMSRQGRIAVFREISDEYQIPVGVWLVRETVSNAFKNAAITFETKEELLTYLKTKLKRPLKQYLSKSRILTQKKLIEWA